ncbi:serine acetyltransferase [Hydrogenophaga crassostreae]|uniref:Serine acetyltransferase n=2 Tax=Hydrogenophaga crassostreae TaxID=1763535 RepID=A0A167I2T1_9BURK|nr:serine acetyltransferase [Hydrogenophaga crassostreae]OAD42059.1 serine acetyltransferase [Hydrogenophaga crassostreae]
MVHLPPHAPPMTDNQVPDWSREQLQPGEWNPGKHLLSCIRRYQRYQQEPPALSGLRIAWAVLQHRFWSAVTGADIPLNCQLGGGLLLPHPNGVVIHPDARVGPNCLIFQQVTLGSLASGGTPVIGGHVDIGAGAKLLGGITIGDHARIGANAVVLANVPAGSVAVGAPARCLPLDREAASHA